MIKKIVQLLFESVFLLLLILCMVFHRLVLYGISQGTGQLAIVWDAKPVEQFLQDPSFPDVLKQKLNFISEIKQYAVDSLGMHPSDNYSTLYDQHNKPILLTISACEPFSFHPKEWTFPFLGTVSYKGFFDKNDAKKELLQLKMEKFDVSVYSPSAWSTLGWFKDPILSNMLKNSEGDLASLIIHELTHGTLYVKNNVTFNENLANFIGDKGAERFLINRFGKNSKEYIDYIQAQSDEKVINEYMLRSLGLLDSLYNGFASKETEKKKYEQKKALITKIILGVNQLPLFNKKNYFRYSLRAFAEGNAFFMSFIRYDSQRDIFEKEYSTKCNANLKMYLHYLKEKYPSL